MRKTESTHQLIIKSTHYQIITSKN